MPRHRSMKVIFVEAIVFIGLLTLVGHLGVNFWERFVIKSELTHMKTSLHSLKKTLANIGTAYDHLHEELKDLLEITEQKRFSTQFDCIGPKHICKSNLKHTLDRRRLHDIHVKALLLAKGTDNDIVMKSNKTTEKNMHMENKTLEAILKSNNPGKNATTITRYPLKSTGVGHKIPERCSEREACRYRNTVGEDHKCCKDFEYCEVKHIGNNWKT